MRLVVEEGQQVDGFRNTALFCQCVADRFFQRERGAREAPGANRLTLRSSQMGESSERMEDTPLVFQLLRETGVV